MGRRTAALRATADGDAAMNVQLIDEISERGDPQCARIIVGLAPPSSFDTDHWPLIIVSQRHEGGQRTAIAMSPRAALELAATLAATARAFIELDS